MTRWQRMENIAIGAGLIFLGLLLLVDARYDYYTVTTLISLTMLIYGLRLLVYYFRMARLMVGGKRMLFRGVIAMDLGLYTYLITDVPRWYVMLYLIVINAFGAAANIVHAVQERRAEASAWKRDMAGGAAQIALSAVCLLSIRSIGVVVVVYCVGLLTTGITKVVSAFRKTEIVYVR